MVEGSVIENPFRPGAGQQPPVMAGRLAERQKFRRFLQQDRCSRNIFLTGERGYGKTVLLADFKKVAAEEGWIWVGNDMSDASSRSEDHLAVRILTDLSYAIAEIMTPDIQQAGGGNANTRSREDIIENARQHAFNGLAEKYEKAPGLPSDKLKAVIGRFSKLLNQTSSFGIVLAYDEAHYLCDHAGHQQFPLSMLIETIGALQKTEGVCPILLVMSGPAEAVDALTSTRTYAERMFEIMRLHRLDNKETAEALAKPLQEISPQLRFSSDLVAKTIKHTCGHPYLIQFFGKELVEAVLENGGALSADQFPTKSVYDKLEEELFDPRWKKTSAKQKEVLGTIACLRPGNGHDFSAEEIARGAVEGASSLKADDVQNVLQELHSLGLICGTQRNRYTFMTPLVGLMVKKRMPAAAIELEPLAERLENVGAREEKHSGVSALWYRGQKMRPA